MFVGSKDATKLVEKPKQEKQELFSFLAKENYTVVDLADLDRRDWVDQVRGLVAEDVDLSTVFICGGFAAYIAGFTNEYGDIDFFCTSRATFNIISRKLMSRKDSSDKCVKGLYKGIDINVLYFPDAVQIEEILDTFDMTWCRAGIDLAENCLVTHPKANDPEPVFEASYFCGNMAPVPYTVDHEMVFMQDRAIKRFKKYATRRVSPYGQDIDEMGSRIKICIERMWTRHVQGINTQQTSFHKELFDIPPK